MGHVHTHRHAQPMREDLFPLTEESSTQGGGLPRLGKVRDQMVRKTERHL